MADPISDLRAAGFGDDEIGAWAVEKRGALTEAGFKDNEIDAFFVGGPVVSDGVPPAMEARINAGQEARKREGGLLQTVPHFADLMSSPDGRTKLWDSVKKYPGEFISGMVDQVKVPGEVAKGNLDLNTPDGMDQAIGLGALVGLGRLNKLSATGKTSGLSVATGEQVARIDRGPMGEIRDLPIGGLPKSEDFVSTAKGIAGDETPPLVQEKLVTLYQEHGIHPAEVAHDAATNPVIMQKLLSSDVADLPYVAATKEPERIAGAAFKYEDQIFAGANHGDAYQNAIDQLGFDPLGPSESPQGAAVAGANRAERKNYNGFVTTEGRFVDRQEAARIANENDQAYGQQDSLMAHHLKANDPTLTEPTPAMAAANNADVIKSDVITGGDGKPPAPPSVPSVGGGEGGKPPIADAQKAISDKISVGARDPQAKVTLDKLYTEAVDSLHPLKGVDGDAYQLARLTRGQFAKAQHFLEHGTFEFNTYKNNGRALKDILEPVRDDLDGLRTYLASKRAVDIEASGRKSGMDLEAAKKVAADGVGKYEDIAAQIGQYQDNLLTYLKDSGVLSDAAYTAMREANKNYVPFFRLMGAGEKRGVGKGFGPGNPVKRLEGSDRNIIDPLESIIKNTYAYVSVAERNAVGIKLIDTLKKTGSEVSTSKLPAKDADLSKYLSENGVKSPDDLAAFVRDMADDGETISAYRNGVKESVKVDDPELVRAFRGLDSQNLDILTRILSVPAKTLRAGAVLTPDFIARNIVRDFLTAFTNTKGAVFTPLDTAKGLKSVITKDADFQNWLKSGGANATLVSLDRRYLQESLQKLTGETGLGDRAWNVVKSPLTGLRMLSELAENATRLGEFKKVLGESAAKEDIQKAGFASREVTMDFARIGASMRAYNSITAFGNAQIQGVDRIVRSFKDNPTTTMARVAGSVTLPSMLLWWANHEDPRYKEIPQWQRDLFWIVMTKDHIYRIPKPFETGVIFGSGVERILDATIGGNPDAFNHFSKSMIDMLSPNFIPTAAAPMVDQFANRSTFVDRTLIPSSMEKFLPEYQYTEYTTEASKALGGIIASFPGIREASISDEAGAFGAAARAATSPILIESYIRAWTGGMGTYALNVADTTLRKAGVLPDPIKPESTLADIPFIKAFAVRYPSAGAQSIQDFYDGHARSTKYFDTWMSKAKEGDAAAMANIQAAGGPMMFARLDGIQKVLSEHSKLVRDIYKDPTMPGPEKRQLIDQLYNSMIGIAGSGKQMMKQIEAAQ